jgi:hypothetical protein
MAGNVGFVFTNSDLPKVRDMILANRVPAPARVGATAPVDVIVPAGPTGCDPGQTSFFQVGILHINKLMTMIKGFKRMHIDHSNMIMHLYKHMHVNIYMCMNISMHMISIYTLILIA